MLVHVLDADDAAQAGAAGADLIEAGVAIAKVARAAFAGALRLAAEHRGAPVEAAEIVGALPVDEIAIAFDPGASDDVRQRYPGTAIIARLAMSPDLPDVVRRLGNRADAVVLDTGPARLLDQATIAALDGFAETCRVQNLPFGFQGGLEAPDVARLLLLEPDVLGFDAAVRLGHDPKGALDLGALRVIRSLIPRETERAWTKVPARQTGSDRVFVRDFVVALSIGAYKAEQDARQRVRFSVEVDVKPGPAAPHDMGDVFSYDIIIETIRVRTARAHVVFVETLAEEVAAALLEHAAVRSATVKVEKLDVVDGAVGIEIHRRRDFRTCPELGRA